ncbi:hypothetical protein ColTof4_13564 [Colletotrichum tofieldiae]|nr:hypothetical protein ColTof3_14516 [Colletotrichum tofieldiae]GKT81141.1 hypothetical protein ColTof4_13564 [Colletotrichum tofieldiae]GKT97345.1 hypothetical protein Ct61P_15195 [Colletotrichum tofieldiae]
MEPLDSSIHQQHPIINNGPPEGFCRGVVLPSAVRALLTPHLPCDGILQFPLGAFTIFPRSEAMRVGREDGGTRVEAQNLREAFVAADRWIMYILSSWQQTWNSTARDDSGGGNPYERR